MLNTIHETFLKELQFLLFANKYCPYYNFGLLAKNYPKRLHLGPLQISFPNKINDTFWRKFEEVLNVTFWDSF